MLNVSPYADVESGAPSWRTGERESAIVFMSLALYIILDVNVSIYRVFRRKRGLYYWSLMFATWGTAVVVVGNILKNFKPEWGVIWPFDTLLINGGWSIYAPAELFVLYSRLHLVNQNAQLHHYLLIMIIVGSTLIIIPNWVFIFPAYDVNLTISSEWSPRMAIIDRVSQAGFTLFEVIISSVYIHSLRDILRSKINTRTRRVMRDLILVNITVISMDLLVIILIFLNQSNLAYPLQDLTYAFKFKIEFAVLNQLMAVAASGSRYGSGQTTWEEKRYRRPGQATILKGYSDDDLTGVRLPFLSTSTDTKSSPQNTLVTDEEHLKGMEAKDYADITKPQSIITKDRVGIDSHTHDASTSDPYSKAIDQHFAFHPGPDLALSVNPSSNYENNKTAVVLEQTNSNDRLLAPLADDGKDLTLANPGDSASHSVSWTKRNRFSLRQAIMKGPAAKVSQMFTDNNAAQSTKHQDRDERRRIAPFALPDQEGDKKSGAESTSHDPVSVTHLSQRRPGGDRSEQREDEKWGDEERQEDDDIHAWERHGTGKPAFEVPWFDKHDEDAPNRAVQ